MKFFLAIFSFFCASYAHAQTEPDFHVSKITHISYEQKDILLNPTQQDLFLLMCAVDLKSFKSEAKALQASDFVGGMMLIEEDHELLWVRYRNLFSYGPGYVYFDELGTEIGFVTMDPGRYATSGLTQFKVQADQVEIKSKNINLSVSADGHAKFKSVFKELNRYDFRCQWNPNLKTSFLKP